MEKEYYWDEMTDQCRMYELFICLSDEEFENADIAYIEIKECVFNAWGWEYDV